MDLGQINPLDENSDAKFGRFDVSFLTFRASFWALTTFSGVVFDVSDANDVSDDSDVNDVSDVLFSTF